MVEHLAILAVGLVALVKGADLLVEHSARLARRFGVSDLVVGLILTSVGTSLPELASSIAAALAGSPGLVIGNVVGSNIANIGLVLGAAAVVRPFDTDPKSHDRDGFMLIATAVLLWSLALDNRIGRVDAALFVLVYVAYTAFVVHSDREGVEHRFKDFLVFVFDFEYAAPVARGLARRTRRRGESAEKGVGSGVSGGRGGVGEEGDVGEAGEAGASEERGRTDGLARDLVIVVVALAAVIGGAHLVVGEAVWVARLLDLPENLIGLSLVAIGTSLPELLVAVTAARRGSAEMVLGNVLGSNIANTMLVVGIAGVVHPLDVHELSVIYTMPIMLFFSIGLLYFIRSDWRIGRGQGWLALSAYVAFLAAAFLQGWG